MNGKKLSKAIKEGKRVYGSLVVSTSPKWLKYINMAGMDFVFIDTEHVSICDNTLSWMCRGYEAANLAPIVRIPSPDPYIATHVLDGGACGILAPYIETIEQVKALYGAIKLRPLKGQKLENILNGKEIMDEKLKNYTLRRNENNLFMINIESVTGLNALDEILALNMVDAVIIGPHDLSCSLSIPEEYDNPIFDEAVRSIMRKTLKAKVGIGIHFMNGIDKEITWAKEEGYNVIIHSGDLNIFVDNVKKDLNRIKDSVGDLPKSDGNTIINI